MAGLLWPFTFAELTAGLRRYFADPSVQVVGLRDWALPRSYLATATNGMRGLRIEYTFKMSQHPLALRCVLKDLRNQKEAAQLGRREIGIYRALAPHIPLETPALIAADAEGRWLVLEAVDAHPITCTEWTGADYQQAVKVMATLHERFWGLGSDLAEYPWLAHPLTVGYQQQVFAMAHAFEKIILNQWPPLIAHSIPLVHTIAQLLTEADKIVNTLRALPPTLLQGGFSPDSILRDEDGEFVVIDWQAAAIGPGVLDLAAFLTTALWNCGTLPVPLESLVELYRAEITQCVGVSWDAATWAELWDYAYLWRFMHEVLPRVSAMSPEEFKQMENQVNQTWLQPVLAIATRRFPPMDVL